MAAAAASSGAAASCNGSAAAVAAEAEPLQAASHGTSTQTPQFCRNMERLDTMETRLGDINQLLNQVQAMRDEMEELLEEEEIDLCERKFWDVEDIFIKTRIKELEMVIRNSSEALQALKEEQNSRQGRKPSKTPVGHQEVEKIVKCGMVSFAILEQYDDADHLDKADLSAEIPALAIDLFNWSLAVESAQEQAAAARAAAATPEAAEAAEATVVALEAATVALADAAAATTLPIRRSLAAAAAKVAAAAVARADAAAAAADPGHKVGAVARAFAAAATAKAAEEEAAEKAERSPNDQKLEKAKADTAAAAKVAASKAAAVKAPAVLQKDDKLIGTTESAVESAKESVTSEGQFRIKSSGSLKFESFKIKLCKDSEAVGTRVGPPPEGSHPEVAAIYKDVGNSLGIWLQGMDALSAFREEQEVQFRRSCDRDCIAFWLVSKNVAKHLGGNYLVKENMQDDQAYLLLCAFPRTPGDTVTDKVKLREVVTKAFSSGERVFEDKHLRYFYGRDRSNYNADCDVHLERKNLFAMELRKTDEQNEIYATACLGGRQHLVELHRKLNSGIYPPKEPLVIRYFDLRQRTSKAKVGNNVAVVPKPSGEFCVVFECPPSRLSIVGPSEFSGDKVLVFLDQEEKDHKNLDVVKKLPAIRVDNLETLSREEDEKAAARAADATFWNIAAQAAGGGA